MSDQTTARQKITNLLWWSIPSHDTAEAKAKAEQMLDDHAAEVRRQHTEMLAPQQCPAGLHADWLVDSEYTHACPWCQIEKLHTDAAAELMPVWEAVYEPGNVSDYLIGYMNDQDAATGAAEAWLRSQAEVTGRLEWVPWGDVTPMPDGYDRWFELAQRHDDGVDTGPGITVRRRKDPAPAPPVAPLAASQPSEAPVEPDTATRPPTGRTGDPLPAEEPFVDDRRNCIACACWMSSHIRDGQGIRCAFCGCSDPVAEAPAPAEPGNPAV